MSHKLTCVITGRTLVIDNNYYDKKVTEYGSADNLQKLYACRQAKNLLKKSYSVPEVRDLLKVELSLPAIPEEIVSDIIGKNTEEQFTFDQSVFKKSDPLVTTFIANIKNL